MKHMLSHSPNQGRSCNTFGISGVSKKIRMGDKSFYLQFHHNGVFTIKKYLGGSVFRTTKPVDADYISYYELQGYTSEDLGNPNIGGIYVQTKEKRGAFTLLENDVDVAKYLENLQDDDVLSFFIDNDVDIEANEPGLDQAVVALSELVSSTATSKLLGSPRKLAKVPVKRKRNYVTLQGLKKQQEKNKQSSQEQLEGEKQSSGQDLEKIRAANIEKNKEKFSAFGLNHLASAMDARISKHSGGNGKAVLERDEVDPEFVPTDDAMKEAEIEDIVEISPKSRIEELSCGDNTEQVEQLIGEGTSREYLVGRMSDIKKPKEIPECSAAATVTTDLPEGALEEIKSQLREEVRDEFKHEL